MDANDTLAAVQQLAARIDKLLDLTRRLAEENRSLRQGQEQLVNERAQLLNKNELARSRVEAMIHRLKSLENNA
jgi:cell division protein ZapB